MNRSPLLEIGHVRLKQCRHGPMLYLVADRYIGQSLDCYGEFSEGEADLFCRLVAPGWTVLEVGANIGAHTVALAKAVGPGGAVHAVEPQRVVFQILSANVALNALSNVYTHHAAMGRQAATITVPRIDYSAPGNFGGISLENAAQGDRVPLIPADSLDLPRCDLIKVDVEGMEAEVIAGAARTIRRFRPVLYVENDREEKSAALIRQLFALGYRLYWHFPPLFNPQNYFGVAENLFAGTVSVNMLGVHASSPLKVEGFREITDPDQPWRDAVGNSPRAAPADAGGGAVPAGLSPVQERAANSADDLNQIGIRLAQQGRLEESLLSFRRALEIQPGLAQTHHNLGITLQDLGRLEEAVASYRRALALKPDYAIAHNSLGTALKEQGNLDEAVACFRRALQLKPDDVMACSNLANSLNQQGQLAEAVACYRRVLTLKPDFAEGYADLGGLLRDQGRVDEAVACCRRALELKPDFAEALANLGVALRDQGNLDEAVACQRRALELKPDFAVAYVNLGIALVDLGRFAEAMACYDRALELEPDLPEARLNRSLLMLLSGDFQHGWPEYEWRWQAKQRRFVSRFSQRPLWDGCPLQGKTILLYAEQGLGDVIQFIRYAPLVKQRGARVLVECQKPLVRLLAGCRGVDELFGLEDDLPPFDYHAPLLSLPGIFQTRLDTLPAEVPYLVAAPSLVETWRRRLRDLVGFKIGIGWQGSPPYVGDRWRSIPLGCFAPLAAMAGVRLVSLQKTAGRGQLAEVGDRFQVVDFADEMDEAAGPFMDTAAIMTQLDLVITSDTAVAHLAGALGVAVWVALPLVPDWRWLLDRDDSPWYPTMRLFRQKKLGDWAGVFDEIKTALSSRR